MGELLTGLYEDLLDFVETPNSNEAKQTTTSTPPVQDVEATSRIQGTQVSEQSEWGHVFKKQQRVTPFRPAQPLKPLLDSDESNTVTAKKVKYFIMKSNNSTNIDRSLATGVWSTQHHNEAKLSDAFTANYEIRLIFSINQSGHFQGYAVMKSAIGRGPKHNIWVGSAWGGFFEIDWQLQYDFPFSRFEHLSNPLNEGKPVKFARDGQEVPPEVGTEMIRIMQDIARSNRVGKPVIPNQLKVEPYPEGRIGNTSTVDRRDYEIERQSGMGRGGRIDGGRGGRGHRWGTSYYGRHNTTAYNNSYGYPTGSGADGSGGPTQQSNSSSWSGSGYYQRNYPSMEYSPRPNYGNWMYGPSIGQKRQRSSTPPSSLTVTAGEKQEKRFLYDMSYDEYLECYKRVQKRVQEVITTGELWKTLGMIPKDYVWGEEDQKRIKESGWFDAWFGDLVKMKDSADANQNSSPRNNEKDVESSSGSRVMTENE